MKGRLGTAAEHFNRDSKKGFAYLQARAALLLLPPLPSPPLSLFFRSSRLFCHVGASTFCGKSNLIPSRPPRLGTLMWLPLGPRLDQDAVGRFLLGTQPQLHALSSPSSSSYDQSMKLLPGPRLDPRAVGRFLRACPGLAKQAIGEILGEKGTFYDEVRAGSRMPEGERTTTGSRCDGRTKAWAKQAIGGIPGEQGFSLLRAMAAAPASGVRLLLLLLLSIAMHVR